MKVKYKSMVYLGVLIILGIAITVAFSFLNKKVDNCFTAENFDKVLDYTKWKQRTSKIGKVIVDSYRVEVLEGNEILFKNDKKGNVIFKVTRNEGIILLESNSKKNLSNKANAAFCEMLKRALFHPVNPQ